MPVGRAHRLSLDGKGQNACLGTCVSTQARKRQEQLLSVGGLQGGLRKKHREGMPRRSWQAHGREGGSHLPGRRGQRMATRSLQRPARVTQPGPGPGKGPSVCPGLLPQHREPRNKGAILSRM